MSKNVKIEKLKPTVPVHAAPQQAIKECKPMPLGSIRPNPWNPNVMDAKTFEREKASITKHGFVDPITVREVLDTEGAFSHYEVLDGEHRYRACTELGHTTIMAVNLGAVPDERAKELTVLFNELKGTPDPLKLGKLLKDIQSIVPFDELTLTMPYTPIEMRTLVDSTSVFDWDAATSRTDPPASEAKPGSMGGRNTMGKERRFLFAGTRKTIQGVLDAATSDAFVAVYERITRVLQSDTPEHVIMAMLTAVVKEYPAPAAPTIELGATEGERKRKRAVAQTKADAAEGSSSPSSAPEPSQAAQPPAPPKRAPAGGAAPQQRKRKKH